MVRASCGRHASIQVGGRTDVTNTSTPRWYPAGDDGYHAHRRGYT
ncbi:hypothetical protein I547_6785 [Mycobacterium kansasii 824]|uniref:Uncharacterized protein n=1 Tax=Mycobacterium kansasii TaxID=1768 RepID=A0A1V3WU99_MYCKA|nr:hypothetical protein I547_6785 [Mycobacterium kansasii 824]OOK70574.1 hypothetical protein BZL30_6622 [Mycobacterium kansasii]